MKLYYSVEYDSETKGLLAEVSLDNGLEVFTIDSPEIMLDLIEADELEHIAYIKGMERYLKHEGIIDQNDWLEMKRV